MALRKEDGGCRHTRLDARREVLLDISVIRAHLCLRIEEAQQAIVVRVRVVFTGWAMLTRPAGVVVRVGRAGCVPQQPCSELAPQVPMMPRVVERPAHRERAKDRDER